MKTWLLKNWNLFSAICLVAGLGWIALWASPINEETRVAPFSSFRAPSFSLPDASGQLISSNTYLGQVVVLNFWASWCEPCKLEMPALEKAYQLYQDKGVVVVGLNATRSDQVSSALNFAQAQGLTFPILLDAEGQASRDFRVQLLPTTFFIGRDGVIHKVVSGGMSEALILATIEELLPAEER